MKNLLILYFFYVLTCLSSLFFEKKTKEPNSESLEVLNYNHLDVKNNRDYDNNLIIHWNPASQQDFNKASAKQAIGFKMEKNDAKKVEGFLYLKINRKWSPIDNFEDTNNQSDEHFECDYVYLGKNNALNQYLIASKGPKGTIKYYLVNKNSAEIKSIGTQPLTSPNYKIFITLDTIPNMENKTNSIHVWQVSKSNNAISIKDYLEIDNQDWTPLEMHWETSKSLIIKAILKQVHNTLKSNLRENDFSFIRMTITTMDQKSHTCLTV